MLQLGESFLQQYQNTASSPRIIELVGDVGAGKTTFVRGLARALGATAPVTSPSFTISKSYALQDGRTLTHYDFYRLQDPGIMVEDLSEKLTDPSQLVVIEWGETIQDFLPPDHTIITILYNDDGTREVTVK